MTTKIPFLFPIIIAVLFAILIALLFDIAIKSSKIKTEYFGAYESLIGYLKSILMAGLFFFLIISNFFTSISRYLLPKDVSFDFTIKHKYTKKALDGLDVMVFMNTSEKKKLLSVGNGRNIGDITVRKDIEEATVIIATEKYKQRVKTFPKASNNNIFSDTLSLVPEIDTIYLQIDTMKLIFIEDDRGLLNTDSFELFRKIKISSHFKRKK
ncbi:MAG: hypothetical protein AABZ60_22910 [Planctomycetota bacterium]